MMNRILLGFILSFQTVFTFAQNDFSGKAEGKEHQAIPGANIIIRELNKKTVTDATGHFRFSNLDPGFYTIELTCIGFKTQSKTVQLPENPTLEFNLEESAIDVKEITVWGNSNALPDRSTKKTEVITVDQFKQKGYLTISEALTALPGVTQITTGPGIARPVIRGLSGNRIATIINGIKLENQQWDIEHSLGLTQFGIDRVEVVKGPASFLYGSEALGGMLNFVDEKPAAINTLEADAHGEFNSNTFGSLTEFGVKKATEKINWSLRAGVNNHSDYYDANFNRVANSRFRELFAKATVGILGKRSNTQFTYQLNMGYYGIVEPFEKDSAGKEEEDHPMEFENPYHTMLHNTFVLRNTFLFNSSKLNTTLSYQNDIRKELEPGDNEGNPFLGFNLNTISGDVNSEKNLNSNMSITLGVQGKLLDNKNFGYARLIPDYNQSDAGLYLLSKNSFLKKRLNVDAALRYDQTMMQTATYGIQDSVDYMTPLNKTFSNISSSLGVNYLVAEYFTIFGNIGNGYRAPNASELTSNGIRLETQRYEKGNAAFSKENSRMGEIGFNIETRSFEFEMTAFRNSISNYIYSERTSDSILSTTAGKVTKWNVYQFKQQDALLMGGEAKVQLHPSSLKWMTYSGSISLVQGKLSDGRNIPLIPPYRVNQEITLSRKSVGRFENTFLRFSVLYVLKQNKTYTNELSTPQYLIINLGSGGEIKMWKQDFVVSAGINNLLNSKFLDHQSRLRQYGVYGMGVNAFVSISWKIIKTK